MRVGEPGVVAFAFTGQVGEDLMSGLGEGLVLARRIFAGVGQSVQTFARTAPPTVSRGSSPVSGSNVERSSDTYSIAFWRNSNRRTPVSYTGRSRSSSRITSATACLPLS